MTEYFTARDISEIMKRLGPCDMISEDQVEAVINEYRAQVMPAS